MKLYLVRHAKARKRATWTSDDLLRPLTQVGHGQAQAIAASLGDAPAARIVSSPYLRCRQTVEPLAAARHLPLELEPRLGEGEDVSKALEWLRSLGELPVVLCSHGDVIAPVLCELEEQGMELRDRLLCEKGSIWVLEGEGARVQRASYVAPPAKGKEARRIAERGVAVEEEPEPEEVRVAVLDLGSTSFHLLVAEVTAEGTITEVTSEREMLRLGSVIAGGGVIPDDVFQRSIQAARALRKTAVKARSERLFPVGTAALRDATNGAELARKIGEALDSPVRILTGAEEARLIFAALRRRIALPPGPSLAFDLGGGSLEIAVGDAQAIHWETTLPLGVARLHGELVHEDPIAAEESEALRERVRECIGTSRVTLSRFAPRACAVTGGTICALARLITARRGLRPSESINALFVPTAELTELADELLGSTHAERVRMPAMSRRRADLLPVGTAILATLAEELHLDGYTVSDWGLREGVIVDYFGFDR